MIVTLPFLLNFYPFRSNLDRNNLFVKTINLGQVVQKPINTEPLLKVKQGFSSGSVFFFFF